MAVVDVAAVRAETDADRTADGGEHMPNNRHVPIRTCVLCGDKRPKHQLIRIVRKDDDSVCIDERSRISGRGCYVCMKAMKLEPRRINDKIKRALKLQTDLSAEFVENLSVRIMSE